MPLSSATEESLRRVFGEGFAARDVAEPLASFDSHTDPAVVRSFMVDRPLQVVGIRHDGLVSGYVEQEGLDNRPLAQQAVPLSQAPVLSTAASLRDVIMALQRRSFILVAVMGQAVGVIERADIQKAPVRMWLFGMVTLIEMRLTRIIKETCPGDTWHEFLSATRIAKARQLHAERQRRNQSLELVDCLQFGDKGQLFARSAELRNLIRLESRRQVEKVVKNFERLRNDLAHGQDIVSENWEMIVNLAEDMDNILQGPPDYVEPNSHTPYG